jgi:hypothetical protein
MLNLDPQLIGLIGLAVLVFILLGIIIRMHFRLKSFLVDVDAKNIADSLEHVSTGLESLERFRTELEIYLAALENRTKTSVRSVHTVRFNPFKGTGAGGNQSFATAFLNEEGNGVVISSLYSRDHVSVFAKPVAGHKSEHELSDEEREAITEAKKSLISS